MNKNLDPTITFDNIPRTYLKCRSDFPSYIKGEDDKSASLNIENLGAQQCKLRIRLLLKNLEHVDHFYHLVTIHDKVQVKTIDYNIPNNTSHVKLDFFAIKKSLKKEAMDYLRGIFDTDVESIYKKNASTFVLQISLLNCFTNRLYKILKFEFCDQKNEILVKAFSPRTILYNDEEMELTFVLNSPEKDNESIFLEMDVESKKKIVRLKDLSKPTSIKNVFLFSLKHMDLNIGMFKARLSRKAGNKNQNGDSEAKSAWMDFEIIDSGIEKGKRKLNIGYDGAPPRKIPRSISTSISESSMSEIHSEEYISNPSSTFSFITGSSKQDLKSILETRVLSSIARVGHDYAFGAPITDTTINVTNKLPIVYVLQDDVGDTPLHNAILKNHEDRALEILKLVYKHFPQELFTRNTSNHTALILSPACGVSANFVQRLLFYGFSVTDKDIDGNNALSIAIEYRNTEVLQILVENAINKKAFKDDISEVRNLLQKTLIANYFEGFKLLIDLHLDSSSFIDLDFHDDYGTIYRDFLQRIDFNNDDVPPLPALDINDVDVDYLLSCEYDS